MKVCLISTYDLGHQPFGIASPARWLEESGAIVNCMDLAVECIDQDAVKSAGLIAIYLPMHTATRLAIAVLPKIQKLNSSAHLAFYGLYATVNKDHLRNLGGKTIISGEFEDSLVQLYLRLVNQTFVQNSDLVSLKRQIFRVPKRSDLPNLNHYAKLKIGKAQSIVAGYTEGTRGCKHICRHCPIVPIYHGRFFVVQPEVVMADIRQQVEAGAKHITFGDPDFFNGPGHAIRLIESFHVEFPNLTYDATIKVEHLLAHRDKLRRLAETGCLFVTTAVEEVDDNVLVKLEKGHTRADFVEAVYATRAAGLTPSPTFIPFHPWTTPFGYIDLLAMITELDLIENVAPVQLAIRLLIPEGSRILELAEMKHYLGGFDAEKLSYTWTPADPCADDLQSKVYKTIQHGEREGATRRAIFEQVWVLAHNACEQSAPALPPERADSSPVPVLSEPWYCCAEPTYEQVTGM
ncbi:MAG: CUAEP/CCAEP-tail radical SAM protein [Pseudomonadales bacterium]|nr:CUAEP/CCAEP-tail radical SAM protein [Pseudomonadales bacterium]